MAAYNAAPYIETAIRSVLSQTFGDFELIVYNDGSTDETAAIVRQFSDARICLLDYSENKGIAVARQSLLEAATGPYVAILDSDDISLSHRLETQIRFLEANPEVVLCGGNAVLIDREGNETGGLLHPYYNPRNLKVRFFFNNIFVNSSVMYRREHALREGGYRDKAPAEDYDLFVRIANGHAIYTFNDPLVYYRVHDQNISTVQREVAIKQLRTIKDEQLRQLGVDAEKHGAVFDALLWGRKDHYFIDDFYATLVALKSANRISKKLPITSFEKELYNRWFNLVSVVIHRNEAAAYLLRRGLFRVSLLSAKQRRRILKFWLRSALRKYRF